MKKFDIFVVYVWRMDKAEFIGMENVLFSRLDISIKIFDLIREEYKVCACPP